MKKIIITSISFFLVASSVSKLEIKNQDIQLEILNTQILSKIDVNELNVNNICDFYSYVYDSLPINKINIKIHNAGKKTYVLYLYKRLYGETDVWFFNTYFQIYNENNDKQVLYPIAIAQETSEAFFNRKLKIENKHRLINEELYRKYYKDTTDIESFDFNNEFNYIVIHPNENKYITFYQTLPSFRAELPQYYAYFLNKDEHYYFQFVLNIDSKKMERIILENQYKEIKDNGYEIFDGELKSNKVPIKFIKM